MRTALPLKVLTPDLALSLRTFNDAARLLQRMGSAFIAWSRQRGA